MYRMTKKLEFGGYKRNCENCPYYDECETEGMTCEDFMFMKLGELEDKIENGTLIDTKVARGQRVYMRGFFKGDIDEYIVSNIVLENGKLTIRLKHDFDEGKTCYSTTVLGIEEIGKTVFLTKAEAEAKELKDDKV